MLLGYIRRIHKTFHNSAGIIAEHVQIADMALYSYLN